MAFLIYSDGVQDHTWQILRKWCESTTCRVIWVAEHFIAPDREQRFPLLCLLMSYWWTWTFRFWCKNWKCILWHYRCLLPLPLMICSPCSTWYPNTWKYHVNQKSLCLAQTPLPPTRGQSRVKIRSCQGVPAPGQQTLHSQQDFATHQLGVVLLLCPRKGCLHQTTALQLYTSITLGLTWSAKHPPEHVGVNQLGIKWMACEFPMMYIIRHAIVITGWTLVQSILVNICLNTLWSIRHSTYDLPPTSMVI